MTNQIMKLDDAYATAVNERTIVGRVRSRAALQAEVDRVVAERDALKADAERYRWLREQDENQFRALAYETPDWIDAYIDAMKGES